MLESTEFGLRLFSMAINRFHQKRYDSFGLCRRQSGTKPGVNAFKLTNLPQKTAL